jgi:hypothetical protein
MPLRTLRGRSSRVQLDCTLGRSRWLCRSSSARLCRRTLSNHQPSYRRYGFGMLAVRAKHCETPCVSRLVHPPYLERRLHIWDGRWRPDRYAQHIYYSAIIISSLGVLMCLQVVQTAGKFRKSAVTPIPPSLGPSIGLHLVSNRLFQTRRVRCGTCLHHLSDACLLTPPAAHQASA